MAEIVNLRQARKRQARERRRDEADRNSLLHGRTRAEKLRAKAEEVRAVRFLDGHRIDRGGPDDEA